MSWLRRLFRPGRPAAASTGPRIPPGKRVYAIGDIHGRADLLGEIRERIADDLDRSPVGEAMTVFTGDYVDRGPDSKAVVEQLAAGSFPTPTVTLRGNHEAMLLAFLARPEVADLWRRNGGVETLHSYGVDVRSLRSGRSFEQAARQFGDCLPAAHLRFLQALPLSFSVGDYFFCHAGVRPGIALDRQQEEDLLWIRDEFLSCRDDFGKVVVHGHTPVPEPEIRKNRINIDTGAYISSRLTCLVLEEAEQRFLAADGSAAKAFARRVPQRNGCG